MRKLVAAGVDPLEDRDQKQATEGHTFESVAALYIDAHRTGWRNPKHVAQWEATLKAYAFPHLGQMPVDQIATPDVLAVPRLSGPRRRKPLPDFVAASRPSWTTQPP